EGDAGHMIERHAIRERPANFLADDLEATRKARFDFGHHRIGGDLCGAGACTDDCQPDRGEKHPGVLDHAVPLLGTGSLSSEQRDAAKSGPGRYDWTRIYRTRVSVSSA